jgi:hypothetical protein
MKGLLTNQLFLPVLFLYVFPLQYSYGIASKCIAGISVTKRTSM